MSNMEQTTKLLRIKRGKTSVPKHFKGYFITMTSLRLCYWYILYLTA